MEKSNETNIKLERKEDEKKDRKQKGKNERQKTITQERNQD